MVSTGNNLKYNYTVIELLVVIVIVGILLAASMGGLGMMTKRSGSAGAVRTISSKISMARSYAVVRNRHVAILMPNDNKTSATEPAAIVIPTGNYTVNFTNADLRAFYYTKSRICFVVYDQVNSRYNFDSWLEGSDWESLPAGTCGYISSQPQQVWNFQITTEGSTYANLRAPAIIFKPTGMIYGGNEVVISVVMGNYLPDKQVIKIPKTAGRGGKLIGWDITINPFTGRSDYVKNN
jgi:Tfp pilus assembly protein FimT